MPYDKLLEDAEQMPSNYIPEIDAPCEEKTSRSSSLEEASSHKDQLYRQAQEQQLYLSRTHWRPQRSSLQCTIILSLSFILVLILSISTTFTVIATSPLLNSLLQQSPARPYDSSHSKSSCPSADVPATSSSPPRPERISCHPGSPGSEQECIFDPMLLSWLPRSCIDFTVLNSTLNSSSPLAQPPYNIGGSFQVYADAELNQPLSIEEVAELDQILYHVTLGFHRAHCAYMFRLTSAAAGKRAAAAANAASKSVGDEKEKEGREGTYVWSESVDPVHIDHCAKVLASRKGDLGNSEQFQAGMGECVLLS